MTDTEIKKEFAWVHEQFDSVQKQFDEVQKQFDGVQKQFDEVHEQFAEVKNELKDFKDEMLHKFFLFEHEYGTKIDAMYDAIILNTDKNLERAEKVRTLDKRVDRVELNVLNHDQRISNLEMKK